MFIRNDTFIDPSSLSQQQQLENEGYEYGQLEILGYSQAVVQVTDEEAAPSFLFKDHHSPPPDLIFTKKPIANGYLHKLHLHRDGGVDVSRSNKRMSSSNVFSSLFQRSNTTYFKEYVKPSVQIVSGTECGGGGGGGGGAGFPQAGNNGMLRPDERFKLVFRKNNNNNQKQHSYIYSFTKSNEYDLFQLSKRAVPGVTFVKFSSHNMKLVSQTNQSSMYPFRILINRNDSSDAKIYAGAHDDKNGLVMSHCRGGGAFADSGTVLLHKNARVGWMEVSIMGNCFQEKSCENSTSAAQAALPLEDNVLENGCLIYSGGMLFQWRTTSGLTDSSNLDIFESIICPITLDKIPTDKMCESLYDYEYDAKVRAPVNRLGLLRKFLRSSSSRINMTRNWKRDLLVKIEQQQQQQQQLHDRQQQNKPPSLFSSLSRRLAKKSVFQARLQQHAQESTPPSPSFYINKQLMNRPWFFTGCGHVFSFYHNSLCWPSQSTTTSSSCESLCSLCRKVSVFRPLSIRSSSHRALLASSSSSFLDQLYALVPCGHVLDETTVHKWCAPTGIRVPLRRSDWEQNRQWGWTCPVCRVEIQEHTKLYFQVNC